MCNAAMSRKKLRRMAGVDAAAVRTIGTVAILLSEFIKNNDAIYEKVWYDRQI
ncbi:histidine kinase [Parageobacillus thermoglucosidasius]|uniref:Histidine kinase n=1 Tax=Parageobacillus thermoglucosidasius TaxID=1426 RepID=A0AAN0YLP5_PARTM|nr:histidine kinase [Parageobacillus thermoglucosidasius]GAJ44007.1 hypothetical protein GT2_14_00200 [Parageobacillus thermoglucosidasius NBRC 107763]ANZ28926.1 histidine kinase [Parageobacillus thermoglucosidasius]APM79665.1 histidine kinase [Parageobacillus thermoglucosidasius]KJX69433.1 histidine kinase [Parageobacillus thermoglucosidasius]